MQTHHLDDILSCNACTIQLDCGPEEYLAAFRISAVGVGEGNEVAVFYQVNDLGQVHTVFCNLGAVVDVADYQTNILFFQLLYRACKVECVHDVHLNLFVLHHVQQAVDFALALCRAEYRHLQLIKYFDDCLLLCCALLCFFCTSCAQSLFKEMECTHAGHWQLVFGAEGALNTAGHAAFQSCVFLYQTLAHSLWSGFADSNLSAHQVVAGCGKTYSCDTALIKFLCIDLVRVDAVAQVHFRYNRVRSFIVVRVTAWDTHRADAGYRVDKSREYMASGSVDDLCSLLWEMASNLADELAFGQDITIFDDLTVADMYGSIFNQIHFFTPSWQINFYFKTGTLCRVPV